MKLLLFLCLVTFFNLFGSKNFASASVKTNKENNPANAVVTDRAYFVVQIGDQAPVTLDFELFGEVVPKTVKNFLAFCKGHDDGSKVISYENTHFHRIIPHFMVQGGDFQYGTGVGGYSIYGDTFDDENFQYHHTQAGLLSMANRGPNTNGSQFFITVVMANWLDGRHVVFGRVTNESLPALSQIEAVGSQDGKPKTKVTILKSGVY